MTPVCVLRSGGDFLPVHVQMLARRVPGLVCLTDMAVPGVACRPLRHAWPGWWSKMEAYGEGIVGDVWLMDLDTLVRRLPLAPAVSTVLPDFYRPTDRRLIGSGFVYVTAADRARIWQGWIQDPEAHMRRCRTRLCWGDQGFLAPYLADAPRWGGTVVSYKVHCRGRAVPAGTEVICYHGRPRPWDTDLWKDYCA